ncbi:carbonic anhydrase [Sulfurimonas sp. HSL-3221]|uniref:carbonic anhydrase n=1 Tax=Thiomicrolovo sulfuroxydans TaxID=2894755 RepID=UPI001E632104|nr:carbonic anhydrase [Sulfurimonas sp. HSL-3221]UFS63269.1 carbonic anhydrase [Sulfurimonas sp. HSL-3221]
MQTYAEGNELFQQVYFKEHEAELLRLAKEGQSPKALFIGCSDSRVIPDLMIQSKPGDLFVMRNVGNFVPVYKPDEDFHATATAIEYAVSVLKVSEIIICGHTHCGACQALYEEISDPGLIHTRKWLSLGMKAKENAVATLGMDGDRETLLRLTEQLSILSQIENLLTYPYVNKLVKEEKLFIHGWYYDIETGHIRYYDPEKKSFVPLSDLGKQHQIDDYEQL